MCKLPGLVQSWSVSQNLNINSSNGLNITVQANSAADGEEGIITAYFSSTVKFEIHIWIGKPLFTFEYNYVDIQPVKSTLSIISADPNFNITKQGVTSIVFRGRKIRTGLYSIIPSYDFYSIRPFAYDNITATVTNACGSITLLWSDFAKHSNNTPITDVYKVFPNPSKDIVNIELFDTNDQPEEGSKISGELFDIMGQSKTKVQIINNKATFSVTGLNKGIYVLKIYINDETEGHQIAVE